MRILLDECVSEQLRHHFKGHECQTARYAGLAGLRFHYQLVAEIHAFPNGNGRHARLLANILRVKHGRPRFTWGRANLTAIGPARDSYFAALHALDADATNIAPLLEFAKS